MLSRTVSRITTRRASRKRKCAPAGSYVGHGIAIVHCTGPTKGTGVRRRYLRRAGSRPRTVADESLASIRRRGGESLRTIRQVRPLSQRPAAGDATSSQVVAAHSSDRRSKKARSGSPEPISGIESEGPPHRARIERPGCGTWREITCSQTRHDTGGTPFDWYGRGRWQARALVVLGASAWGYQRRLSAVEDHTNNRAIGRCARNGVVD